MSIVPSSENTRKPTSTSVILSSAASQSLVSTTQRRPTTSANFNLASPASNLANAFAAFTSTSSTLVAAAPQTAISSLSSPNNRVGLTSAASLLRDDKSAPVFQTTRAKKLFQQFDANHDGFLSPSEFDHGLRSWLLTGNASNQLKELDINLTPAFPGVDESGNSLTQAQLDALFKEADFNRDGRISLAEFLCRFAGGPTPSEGLNRPSLVLQTLKRQVKDANKISVDDVRAVLEAVFDGPKPRYKAVDLTKIEQVSNAGLKRILMQCLNAEKDEAAKDKRACEDWAQHIFKLGGLLQKDVDKLFNAIDTKKTGRIDLGPIFAVCQLKPSRFAQRKKKSKQLIGGALGYLLVTVAAEHCRDWINDLIYTHTLQLSSATITTPASSFASQDQRASTSTSSIVCKCHPPLAHWGDAERMSKGLTRSQSGYKCLLLLSERTKLRTMIKHDKGYSIFALFRTEFTELKRSEYLYHCRVELNSNEEFESIEAMLKCSWRDGELEQMRSQAHGQSHSGKLAADLDHLRALHSPPAEFADSENDPATTTSTDQSPSHFEILWAQNCSDADEFEMSIPSLTKQLQNSSNSNSILDPMPLLLE